MELYWNKAQLESINRETKDMILQVFECVKKISDYIKRFAEGLRPCSTEAVNRVIFVANRKTSVDERSEEHNCLVRMYE